MMPSLSEKLGCAGLALTLGGGGIFSAKHETMGGFSWWVVFVVVEAGLVLMLSSSVVEGSFQPSGMKREIKRSGNPIEFWSMVLGLFVIFNVILIAIATAQPSQKPTPEKFEFKQKDGHAAVQAGAPDGP